MANDLIKFGDNEIMKMGEDIKLELKRSTVVTPKNYSFENALIAARLILSETVDRNKRPALEVCSQQSIHKALLAMATQGLNPAKAQCYFVVYGSQLQCIRSYMGGQMTAKLVNPEVKDIRAQVIYAGDEVEIDIENGRDIIKSHKRKFADMSKAEIIGAYAIAIGENETQLFSDLMNIDDIKQSWKQSQRHNEQHKKYVVTESGNLNPETTHAKFTVEMAKRTVINRLCKRIINTSDDTALLAGAAETDEDRPETEIIQAEIQQNANKKLLDFPRPERQQFEAPDDHPNVQQPPAIPMATREQGAKIFAMAHDKNWEKEKTLQEVSGFVGRVVTKLRELTFSEAEEFIAVLIEEQGGTEQPDWASN